MSAIPTQIGSYEIRRLLGRGGMGEVYLAYDPRLSRDVALKVLSEESAGRSNRVQKFRDEARLVASLNHPNIATVHAFESEGGRACLAMEYVPGQSLAERLKEDPLPQDQTLTIAEQLADALRAAHAAGLVHRDLKPGNVMLRPDGKIKVLDFGLARDVSHSSSKRIDTSQDSIVGTAGYAAPEQLRRKDIGQQVDLWAYGCILYECLCGQKAFGGKDVRATVLATIQQDPDLSLLPEGTPAALRQLILGCLAKSPHDRITDFEDVLMRLRRIRNSLSRPLRNRTRWLAPLLSAVTAGVLIAILIWALNGQQPGLGDSDSPPRIATGMGGGGGGSSSGTGPGDTPLTNPEPTPRPAEQSTAPTGDSAAQAAAASGQSDQQAEDSPDDPNRGEFDSDDLKTLAEDIKDPPRIVGGGGGSIFVDEGRGASIVYVIDFSGSMDGTRLNAAKRHLLNDIERLESHMRFYVIFFDVQQQSIPRRSLLKASDSNKALATRWISDIEAGRGHTDPTLAMNKAFKLNPDTIYLLSDGEFDQLIVGDIAHANANRGITINTIAFHSLDGRFVLQAVAEQNGGVFVYVPEPGTMTN